MTIMGGAMALISVASLLLFFLAIDRLTLAAAAASQYR